MSKIESETVKCSNCGEEFSIIIYESINVTNSPELKHEFFSGELNKEKCPKCGLKYAIHIPVLYHDMKGRFMIFVLPESFRKDKERYFKEYMPSLEKNLRLLEGFGKNNRKYVGKVVVGVEELKKEIDRYSNNGDELIDVNTTNKELLKCMSCEKEIENDSKFCEFCGKKIKEDTYKELVDEILSGYDNSSESTNEVEIEKSHKKNKYFNFNVLKDLVIVGSVFGVSYFFLYDRRNVDGSFFTSIAITILVIFLYKKIAKRFDL